jgi:hypothetical protein
MILLRHPPRCEASLDYVANFQDQRPTHGGPNKRINRLGDHWAYSLSFPARGDQGMAYAAKLNAGLAQKVRVDVRQPAEYTTVPGPVTIGSAVSGGSTIVLAGLPVGHVLMGGQLFSVIGANGVSYLHQITDDATANGSGRATLTVIPAVRTVLNVADVVQVNSPVIEGYLVSRINPTQIKFTDTVEIGFQVEESE